MSEMRRCAACGKENPVSEMKVCMHHQMHRYVCDSKCMTDFYNPPKKPTVAELEAKVAALEAELAKLRAGQEPVAMLCEDVSEFGTVEYFEVLKRIEPGTKLYTTPQPSAVPDGWRLMIDRLADEVERLNDCMRDQIDDDMDDPECEHEWCDETDELVQEARAMLAAAPAAPTVQGDGWIPVSERMPEVGQYLLVSGPRGEPGDGLYRMTGIMREDGIYDGYGCWLSDATHWMPLPAAPAIAAARKEGGK